MSLISVTDYSGKEILDLIDSTGNIKSNPDAYRSRLRGGSLACLFEKPSTRTRISFELAVNQLGGHSVILHRNEMQLGRGETVEDTARVLERYVDAVMARVYEHQNLLKLDEHSQIPVINGLSGLEHPCQVLSDLYTISEVKNLDDISIAYVGDGNNVCNSLIYACSLIGASLKVATPQGFEPSPKVVEDSGKNVKVLYDPFKAVSDVDVVYTDVWASMGEEDKEVDVFKEYQVNQKLMSEASDDAVFMHCLPAHRGQEVTGEVMDSSQSIVWRQAENRLHMQKSILLYEVGGIGED